MNFDGLKSHYPHIKQNPVHKDWVLWGMVDSICIFACGENYCSHQFLNWWQQLSTGQLHLDGFESTSKQKRDTPKGVSLFWWGMVDSNHRRHSQQIYSLSPLATREIPHIKLSAVCLEPVDGLEPPTY